VGVRGVRCLRCQPARAAGRAYWGWERKKGSARRGPSRPARAFVSFPRPSHRACCPFFGRAHAPGGQRARLPSPGRGRRDSHRACSAPAPQTHDSLSFLTFSTPQKKSSRAPTPFSRIPLTWMTPLCREARIHGLCSGREREDEMRESARRGRALSPNAKTDRRGRDKERRPRPHLLFHSLIPHRLGWKDRPFTRLLFVSNLVWGRMDGDWVGRRMSERETSMARRGAFLFFPHSPRTSMVCFVTGE